MMKRYLYLTVFFSGMTVLAVELSASRLIGRAFGTSNIVWASIIGLILSYLALGYYLGGRLADHSPTPGTFYRVLAWGAFLIGLVPLPADPVLRLAAGAFDQLEMGALFGSFTAVLLLFVAPVTLLAMVSPFALRLAVTDSRRTGRTAGELSAISTLGSFLGSFLPVLLTLPLIGTTRTFLLFSLLLNLVALIGLLSFDHWRSALRYAWMPLVLVVLFILGPLGAMKNTAGQIYENESAYNYIEVLETDGYRMLRLNEGQGVHSVWHPTELDYRGPWEQFLAAPFYNPNYDPAQVQRIAIVGLAAGTTAHQATAVFGPLPIDGYEIDPEIIEVGRQYFGMSMPNLTAIAQDGRLGLSQSEERYTIIAVDAYRPPYIPFHLTTREFFEIARDHLTSDGVVVINVGRSDMDRRLVDGLASTLLAVFPSVHVMDVPNSFNTILYATRQPTQIENFYQNYEALRQRSDIHPLLLTAMERSITYRQPTPPAAQVFTDDWSPVEWITNTMVLGFVFSPEMEQIR